MPNAAYSISQPPGSSTALHEAKGETLHAQRHGNHVVVVHSITAPNDADWARMLDLSEQHDVVGVLVLLPAGCPGPSASQRKTLADHWQRRSYSPPTALVTESRLHRGMITAMNWMMGNEIRAFAPTALVDALGHAGLSREAWHDVCLRARDAAEQLDIVRALPYLNANAETF